MAAEQRGSPAWQGPAGGERPCPRIGPYLSLAGPGPGAVPRKRVAPNAQRQGSGRSVRDARERVRAGPAPGYQQLTFGLYAEQMITPGPSDQRIPSTFGGNWRPMTPPPPVMEMNPADGGRGAGLVGGFAGWRVWNESGDRCSCRLHVTGERGAPGVVRGLREEGRVA